MNPLKKLCLAAVACFALGMFTVGCSQNTQCCGTGDSCCKDTKAAKCSHCPPGECKCGHGHHHDKAACKCPAGECKCGHGHSHGAKKCCGKDGKCCKTGAADKCCGKDGKCCKGANAKKCAPNCTKPCCKMAKKCGPDCMKPCCKSA